MYATLSELFLRFGYTELAGVASPDDLMVPSAGALRTLITSESDPPVFPDWVSDAEIASCEEVATKCEYALDSASKEIDSFIVAKYAVPLDDVLLTGTNLPIICCDLARELLYDDKCTEEIKLRADRARSYLAKLASGALPLTASSATPVTLDTVDSTTPTSVWDTEGF